MGMKGTKRGGAVVSPVHANFIVTEGEGARAADALALAEEIRERIRRERGIELEYEVELWRAGGEAVETGRDQSSNEAVNADQPEQIELSMKETGNAEEGSEPQC
ncbi:MAG: hypothetical protein LC742_11535, partial [Acidobacteria bacterium]|nr:hypothetical protein [Acidobacteriota bacterium]